MGPWATDLELIADGGADETCINMYKHVLWISVGIFIFESVCLQCSLAFVRVRLMEFESVL